MDVVMFLHRRSEFNLAGSLSSNFVVKQFDNVVLSANLTSGSCFYMKFLEVKIIREYEKEP